jgi:hypothetical protein
MARYTLQICDRYYGRPEFPDRPEAIALDDHELIEAYRSVDVGVKVSADKRRALAYFGTWRVAIWRAEALAGRSLLAVVDAALTFERNDLPHEAEELLAFAEEQFPRFRATELPRNRAWWELSAWCQQVAKDYNLLPVYMRMMKEPRSGVPFHKAQGERGEAPAEPPPAQSGLPWDR